MLHIIWPRTQVGWIDQFFTKAIILRGPRWEHLTAWSRLRFRKGTFWLAFACSCVAYTLGTHQMWRRQLTNWGGAWKRAGRGYPGHRPSLWAFPGSEEGGRVDFRRKCETIFEGITAPLNSFVWFFEIRNHICDRIWVFELGNTEIQLWLNWTPLKIVILTTLAALNFEFLRIFEIFNCDIHKKSKFKASKMVRMGFIDHWK